MFPSLHSTVFQIRNINGHSKTHFLRFLQNPSFLIIRSISSSISSTNHSSSSSFVVSYLMNSCGLSEDKAISASKKIHFETSCRPDSVLTFLENNGFTKPYISKLINKRPSVLLADPHKTLKPKFEFFSSMGLSDLDLAMVLSNDPTLLKRSLENQIIPSFALLKNIVHTDRNVIAALKRSSWVLLQDPDKKMVPNIELLRGQGVPESNITTLLITQPRALLINAGRFKKIVEEIKGMGFDPLKTAFVMAIHGLTSMSKSTWASKLDVYICPTVLTLSFEKRIFPRCSVIRILVSKGLIRKEYRITTVLTMVEESFLKKYVIKYEQEVPELLKAYQGLNAV